MARIEGFEKKAAVFLIKFFLIYGILQAVILTAPLDPLENAIASLEATALGLRAEGSVIGFNSHGFEIVPNCTGLMSISVLAAVIFSLKKPSLKKKLGLLAVGTAILFPANLLRVYLVLLAAISFDPGIGGSLHITTWFITSAIIVAVWYLLTKRVAGVKQFSELI